ncbi:MAG TPA: tyrosine-type recombinase/integrase [Blastocatellia bacterium]|nr:tyrosine-type recombinase/integrase [Blastocatellia bacterium]
MSEPEIIEQVFESYLRSLAVTRRPGTVGQYRITLRGFVEFLNKHYPEVRTLSQLQRNPHILGWLVSLSQLRSCTRRHQIFDLRRCLRDLADEGHDLRYDLIVRRDLPRQDKYLPRPLSPEDDLRICDQLRKRGTVESTALLLMRATGMRIGECLNLAVDCLHDLGNNQWAIRVPLGKLHTERLVPLDEQARQLVETLLALRKRAPATIQASSPFLLLHKNGCRPCWRTMNNALRKATRRAHCSVSHVTPHQLRHTYATEILRGGASLPAVKELLGHTKIEMTLRYTLVSQVDLQRQYNEARAYLANRYQVPRLSTAREETAHPLVRTLHSLTDAAHILEMYRRCLRDRRQKVTIGRLLNRIAKVSRLVRRLEPAKPPTEKK